MKRNRRKENRDANGQKHCMYCGREIFARRVFCSQECGRWQIRMEQCSDTQKERTG